MPEGDTIHKLAARLRPELIDRPLEQLWWVGRRSQPVPARPVVGAVEAQGKHLLITLGRSAILRVHLGLHGGSSRVSPDGAGRGPGRSAGLATAEAGFVFSRARSVEVFGAGLRSQHPLLSQLGPDLLAPPVPLEVVVRRARRLGAGRTVAAVLLDQRVAAGIGNVYRNDLLYLSGLHPDTLCDDVPDEAIEQLYRTAASLLSQNLGPGRRITTRSPEGRPQPRLPPHYVYGRAGEPCLRCNASIRATRERENARPTWWCPSCQPLSRPRSTA